MKKGVIVYDFDGVLVDSFGAEIIYFRELFSHFNIPSPDWDSPEIRNKIFAMSDKEMFLTFVPGITDDLLSSMLTYESKSSAEVDKAIILEEGVVSTLDKLSEEYYIALCTNRGKSAGYHLDRLGIKKYFSYVVTYLDVTEGKPSPEGLIKIKTYFNLPLKIFVGDTEYDYLAAKGASVPFIAFKNKLHDSDVICKHEDIFKYL